MMISSKPLRILFALAKNRDNLSESETRVAKAGFSSLGQAGNKAVNILVTIVSVPLMVGYLGAEYFGVAMAIAGFAQWFLFDTGIAEGVKVRLIESFACDDRQGARAYISTGLFVLLLIGVVAACLFYVLFPGLNWEAIFNVDTSLQGLHASILLIVSIMLVMIPLKILREIYTANQRGYVFSLFVMTGTIVGLGGIWLATRTDFGIVAILAGLYVPMLVATIACGLYLFLKDMPWLRPSFSTVSMAAWKKMWGVSLGLLMFGIARMMINGTDIFLVNYYKGGSDASVYSLSIRLVLYIEVIVGFLIYPAWPAIADAIQKTRKRWVLKASKTMFGLSFGFAVPACALLVIFGGGLIRVWSRGQIESSWSLLFVLGFYLIIRIWCDVFATLLRALGRVHFLGIATLVEAFLHIGLGIYLLQRMGVMGLAIGSIVSTAVTRGWVLPLECYWAFRRHCWDITSRWPEPRSKDEHSEASGG